MKAASAAALLSLFQPGRSLNCTGDNVSRGDSIGFINEELVAWGEPGETLEVVPRYLITGRRVAGSSFGGVKGRDQVPVLVERAMEGEIDVAPFISHRIGLDEVNRGFELMEAQDGIRSVIEFA